MDKYRHLRLRNEMLSSYYHTAIMLAVEKEVVFLKKEQKHKFFVL